MPSQKSPPKRAPRQSPKPIPPMTMKQFEKSPVDREHDRKSGLKEGSPLEQKQDQQMLDSINQQRRRGNPQGDRPRSGRGRSR